MSGYAYDKDALQRTAELLYAHLPAHLKQADQEAIAALPPEEQQLLNFITVLAAPLAAVRQSVEELHADLFVDTASDAMLHQVAQGIGLDLLFRDADANRRDLAGAVKRRRGKGTMTVLRELSEALTDRLVASNEGWKLVQITQDINLVRPAWVTPDIRAASVADRITGPLESIVKSVDPRPMTQRTGRIHPRHIAHWVHLSRSFPLLAASPVQLPDGAEDLRFAFDTGNTRQSLLARSTGVSDPVRTDEIPEQTFAEDPAAWFNWDGRFSVQIANLPAAANPMPAPRSPARMPANRALVAGVSALSLLDYNGTRTSGLIQIALMAVPLPGLLPNIAGAVRRRAIDVDLTGEVGTTTPAGPAPANAIPMLRLRPAGGAVSRYFAGCVLAVSNGNITAGRASLDAGLAEEGYLRGALFVTIPPLRLTGETWFYIAADGSLHAASADGGLGLDLPLETGPQIAPRRMVSTTPGPVWPPTQQTSDRAAFSPALTALAAPPVILHGGRCLNGSSALPGGDRCALVFALTYFALGRRFNPMLRIAWSGSDPATGSWQALDDSGSVVADLPERQAELADIAAGNPADLALSVRFECNRTNAVFAPAEVSFTGFNGRAVLIHLPELIATDTAANPAWPVGAAPLAAHSIATQVGADGSTWVAGTNLKLRDSTGSAGPLAGPVGMQRRQVRGRRLCAWDNETLIDVLDPTPPGFLDIDPRFGLFAIATTDAPQVPVPGPLTAAQPVTVDLQLGASHLTGALPINYNRALAQAPQVPTRLVSASGHLCATADLSLAGLPIHRTLEEAFDAIASDPSDHETIEIEDSRFYATETLNWPTGPLSLKITAANDTRPVVEIAASVPGSAEYDLLDITGLTLTGADGLVVDLPPAQELALNHVTVPKADIRLAARFLEDTGIEEVRIRNAFLGQFTVPDGGHVRIQDSILDGGRAAGAVALEVPRARLTMDRVTISGSIDAERVDISDSLLLHPVLSRERFKGCIRFSYLAPGGLTPRKHKVIRDVTPRFVSFTHSHPACFRLASEPNSALLTGASDGGEMGAFNQARLAEIMRAVAIRLAEHTPASLRTGLIRRNI